MNRGSVGGGRQDTFISEEALQRKQNSTHVNDGILDHIYQNKSVNKALE
jgi:hypothetical protein